MKISSAKRLALGIALVSAVGAAAADNASNTGYLIDTRGDVAKNSYNECWHTGYWTPAMATEECDPALVKKEAPMPKEKEKEPEPKAEAPIAGPEKPAVKAEFKAETLFDFDKAVVRPEGMKTLDDKVVEGMKAHPEVELLLVTGHTDRIGSDAYNRKLSQRRADAVRSYLIEQGIDGKRIKTGSRGGADPIASCAQIKGKANSKNKKLVDCLRPNRRVVLEISVQRPVQK